ncbi:hypothetical protein BDN71DRAFT_1504485 [Pleurotus eryngii]|uniref:Uncharacterized protein n=1 Tax=Pleurotus eryngii TaxID=5323 RepID=A0A9P6DHC3_PLEER|nr:hypothetical protein BDN71DRAFT_1504485 [Pleurotus eryngii]
MANLRRSNRSKTSTGAATLPVHPADLPSFVHPSSITPSSRAANSPPVAPAQQIPIMIASTPGVSSEPQKTYKSCSSLEKQQCILLALEAIHEGGFGIDGEPLYAIRQASWDFDVPFSTLQGRYHGQKSKAEAHEHQQHFSTAEEQVMVD